MIPWRTGRALVSWTGVLLVAGGVAAGTATGPLRVQPTNRRYFTDGSGRAIYLTGSHTWGNLCLYNERWPAFEFPAYFDFLPRHNHNFHEYEKTKPEQHPVGMTAVFNIVGGDWRSDNEADYRASTPFAVPAVRTDPAADLDRLARRAGSHGRPRLRRRR